MSASSVDAVLGFPDVSKSLADPAYGYDSATESQAQVRKATAALLQYGLVAEMGLENDCHDIFFDRPSTGNKGLASLDKKTHYFGAIGNPRTRPSDVNWRDWARRVDLPRTWHHAGEHYRLTLILYHPRSRFAHIIRPYVANMRIIDYGAITIDGSANENTNPFLNPITDNPPSPQEQPEPSEGSTSDTASSSQQQPPQCGHTPYCSRSSDCSNNRCKCIADGDGINNWISSCKPLLMGPSAVGRELLEENNNNKTLNNSSNKPQPERTTMTTMMIENQPLSSLACPCNCTYVSKACCTSSSSSGIVHEDPRVHRLGSLLPPNGTTLECDTATGNWTQKKVLI
ncbi:MAG: hypothetical protein Q9184_003043 [Pyrenodesmia sp. 2 TL-2023]